MKKGFTLVELLAVIIVLGIISLIALPKINDVISNSRISAGMESAQSYLIAASQYVTSAIDTEEESYFDSASNLLDKISVSGTKAKTGFIRVNENHAISFALHIGDYCYTKSFFDSIDDISYSEDLDKCGLYTPTRCFSYELNEDDTATITDYLCGGTGVLTPDYEVTGAHDGEYNDVYIPSTIDGHDVVKIGRSAFFEKWIDSAIIPEGVTTIDPYAFSRNGISHVSLPNTLTTISDWAFLNSNLSNVTIPNSVTTIGVEAFSYGKLSSITIPNHITIVEAGAFSFNELINVTISTTVTTIGRAAFMGNKLINISIPNTVTTIEDEAFAYNNLVNINLPDSITTINNSTFSNNALTNVTIPNSVTSIGSQAFSNNSTLTSITIDKLYGSISGSPWGASSSTTITYLR